MGGSCRASRSSAPTDKAVRRANLRRIGRLFRPYWAKLGVVTFLILVRLGPRRRPGVPAARGDLIRLHADGTASTWSSTCAC